MKLLLAVIAIFYLTSAATVYKAKTYEEYVAIENDCLKRVPEAHEYLGPTSSTTGPHFFADVPAVHKFVFCFIEGIGLNTNTPGRLDLDSTLAFSNINPNDEEDVKVIKECIDQDNGKNDAENIYKQLKCIRERKE